MTRDDSGHFHHLTDRFLFLHNIAGTDFIDFNFRVYLADKNGYLVVELSIKTRKSTDRCFQFQEYR